MGLYSSWLLINKLIICWGKTGTTTLSGLGNYKWTITLPKAYTKTYITTAVTYKNLYDIATAQVISVSQVSIGIVNCTTANQHTNGVNFITIGY